MAQAFTFRAFGAETQSFHKVATASGSDTGVKGFSWASLRQFINLLGSCRLERALVPPRHGRTKLAF
jgi:hypothetical protein